MIPLPPRSTLFPYTTLFRSLHVAIIGVVAATTARVPGRARPAAPVVVPLRTLLQKPPETRQRQRGLPTFGALAPESRRLAIPLPSTTLPPIDLAAPGQPDTLFPGRDFGGSSRGGTRGIIALGDTVGAGIWDARETALRVTSVARPRFPEMLRSAGIAGRVVI